MTIILRCFENGNVQSRGTLEESALGVSYTEEKFAVKEFVESETQTVPISITDIQYIISGEFEEGVDIIG